MDQTRKNQERARKYGGSSSFVDAGEPSRAPRQDEKGDEYAGSSEREPTAGYSDDTDKQGVSNRPADSEHAFPESAESPRPDPDAPDSVETTPKQLGGNRGRV